MTIKERNVKVLSVAEDGQIMRLEWTTEAGERVSGTFDLMTWGQAPAAEQELFHKITSAPPKAILHPQPQARRRS